VEQRERRKRGKYRERVGERERASTCRQ